MGTLAAAGLPMILRRNTEHIVASKELSEQYGIGILYDSITELATQLHDKDFMDILKRKHAGASDGIYNGCTYARTYPLLSIPHII